MQVDIRGAVRIVGLAMDPGWDWSVGALDQFCAAAGWEHISQYSGRSATLRTNLGVGLPESSVYGNSRKINLISTFVADDDDPGLPGLSEWLAEAFGQLCAAFTIVLGERTRDEPGRKATVSWDKPNMTIELSMIWQAISVDLIRPDGFYGIDYQE
ncbi:DUF6301 family protein [Nocardia bovistercoris]|uniref:Uncharacterized protein n=1 Tax=Nocardia bovistercoris TaxID=2785916 RepID=A0A931N0T7_9NOCA|nr:hypothetical protein [Nocardia bovistercoris]